MSEMTAVPQLSYRLLCILGMTLVTSGFPQPRLPLGSPDDFDDHQRVEWSILFPSISLQDWSIQMSAPALQTTAGSKARLTRDSWFFSPDRADTSVDAAWSTHGAGMVKRNMVVADDAAFREKSKLLTSMERQKWLNTYMQKLLVVNSS
ncbi:tuberoinfundibular peptide of 39 residues-like [Gouania willdenowi]|uniref:Tuberoinfundibular peptide of 39 residues n=1 Tax=Gouania willdenowi TaxID=441366 RepID=A0A8C5DLX0_GOUWI|nr:tuberoinfundibular peptide of 39 residues-like [Gouania willdenowi]